MDELREAVRLLHDVTKDTHQAIQVLKREHKAFMDAQVQERRILDHRLKQAEKNIEMLNDLLLEPAKLDS